VIPAAFFSCHTTVSDPRLSVTRPKETCTQPRWMASRRSGKKRSRTWWTCECKPCDCWPLLRILLSIVLTTFHPYRRQQLIPRLNPWKKEMGTSLRSSRKRVMWRDHLSLGGLLKPGTNSFYDCRNCSFGHQHISCPRQPCA